MKKLIALAIAAVMLAGCNSEPTEAPKASFPAEGTLVCNAQNRAGDDAEMVDSPNRYYLAMVAGQLMEQEEVIATGQRKIGINYRETTPGNYQSAFSRLYWYADNGGWSEVIAPDGTRHVTVYFDCKEA